MTYEEEIQYRNEIFSRMCKHEKVSYEEKKWIATHRIINPLLGYPYLNNDIINLKPNVNYCICIKLERLDYNKSIVPVIAVPFGKGKITTDYQLFDYNGKPASKNVEMLVVMLDSSQNETKLIYNSNLGLLEVAYQCEYFDDKHNLMIRRISSTEGSAHFAMLAEKVSENKIRYRCKIPISDSFENFIFSIEYVES